MASPELDTAGTEGDEKLIMLPSCKDTLLGDTPAHLDFTQLTPSKFGISTHSFTPSSSNQKDKSRLAQLKARRRSNIGVRGSPETNSLIRYMAQQRMKTLATHQTPEPVKSSPFLPKVASTLRQKMASFQSLMDVQESEVCDPTAMQDSNTGGCIKTRDYLFDGRSPDGGKENRPPPMTPTPKRRRMGPLRDCEEEIREASTSILQHRKEQEVDKKPTPRAVTPGPTPSSEMAEEAHAALLFPPLHLDSAPPTSCELQACSPTTNKQEGLFELQSPSRLQPHGPAAALPARPTSPFTMPSLPSLLETKLTGFAVSAGECNCSETSAVKKKRVRFGGPLSPEFFDKNLPPSTPLQKGGTPARAPTPGGCFEPRSVLKTPQRSDPWTPLGQPDFNSASPTLAMPRNCRVQFMGEDGAEMCGKIAFPSMEELDPSLTDNAERTWEAQPLDLNSAFQEESLTETLTAPDPEPEAVPSGTSQINALDQCEPQQETETQAEPAVEAPALGPSINRKRKQPEENEPVKRSTRSAAKSASGKIKTTSRAKRQWGTKEVDRSLYGSREYASKNPTLSPITESLPPTSQSPTPRQPRRGAAQDQEPRLPLASLRELINSDPITGVAMAAALLHSCSPTSSNTQETGDITATDPWENASAAPVESVTHNKGGAVGKGRRRSGPRLRSNVSRKVRGGGLKGRKVSVPVDDQQTQGREDEHWEDQTTTNLEATKETLSTHSVPEDEEVDADEPQTSSDAPCTDTDRDAECHSSLDAPTSACPPLDVEISNTVSLSERRSRGRRRSLSSSVLQDGEEQVSQTVEHQTGHKVEEQGLRDKATSQLETNTQSSSDSQAKKEANLGLTPWQAGFNFEDVFKPVATRGQRSVRRSLRNRSNVDNSGSGLAWLPQISPTSTKEACRRRTRGQRLSAALPVQLPEETTQ